VTNASQKCELHCNWANDNNFCCVVIESLRTATVGPVVTERCASHLGCKKTKSQNYRIESSQFWFAWWEHGKSESAAKTQNVISMSEWKWSGHHIEKSTVVSKSSLQGIATIQISFP